MTPEIHVYGCDAYGAEMACRFLARAFSRIAREVAVSVAPRVGRGPADYAVICDAALLAGVASASLHANALIVVNAPGVPCSRLHGGHPIVAVDVDAIAERRHHPASLSAAMAGAFAAATDLVPLDEILFAIEKEIPGGNGAPLAACAEAWAETKTNGSALRGPQMTLATRGPTP